MNQFMQHRDYTSYQQILLVTAESSMNKELTAIGGESSAVIAKSRYLGLIR